MSQWSVNCHLINEMSFVGDDQIQEGRLLARAVSGGLWSVEVTYQQEMSEVVAGGELPKGSYEEVVIFRRTRGATVDHTEKERIGPAQRDLKPQCIAKCCRSGFFALWEPENVLSRDVKSISISCLVEQGGQLGGGKRVDLPSERLYQKTFKTTYQRELAFACESKVGYVLAEYSFTPHQIPEARSILGVKIKLFAKVQSKESIRNLLDIISVSDGIIVGRNGMGLVYPAEKFFQLQKQIIAICILMQKPVFVISKLLKSMRFKQRATRAEISDVANSVIDEADGLILTVETSRGLFPKEAAGVLHKTCQASITSRSLAIFLATATGQSASTIAAFRPSCSVVAVVRDVQVARWCHSFRGINPFLHLIPSNDSPMILVGRATTRNLQKNKSDRLSKAVTNAHGENSFDVPGHRLPNRLPAIQQSVCFNQPSTVVRIDTWLRPDVTDAELSRTEWAYFIGANRRGSAKHLESATTTTYLTGQLPSLLVFVITNEGHLVYPASIMSSLGHSDYCVLTFEFICYLHPHNGCRYCVTVVTELASYSEMRKSRWYIVRRRLSGRLLCVWWKWTRRRCEDSSKSIRRSKDDAGHPPPYYEHRLRDILIECIQRAMFCFCLPPSNLMLLDVLSKKEYSNRAFLFVPVQWWPRLHRMKLTAYGAVPFPKTP
ncbi:pyruvate kinase [Clonorchis sinensis]|uniref:Pyruvate kinase n=1 Tax=Clonorchis sinensis TaxID=79923 RepID=G7YDF2_CLOSI|nr:pyruvate kinase [Clonorchis sinensis]